MFAIAYDADDGMFPLAMGVVGSENYEDWYWVLEKLKGILDGQEVIIISDRHQGILRSVSELFGVVITRLLVAWHVRVSTKFIPKVLSLK